MRKLVSALVIMLVIGMSRHSVAYSMEVNRDRAMIISGIISRGNVLPLGQLLLNAGTSAPVDLIINSPGGEVVTGFLFINAMEAAKKKGVIIRCFVPTVAASMAFQILLHCNERHVLNKSFLLWHRARIMLGGLFGAPMRGPELLSLGKDLMRVDTTIFNEVLEFLPMPADGLSYHFENETLHNGLELHMSMPTAFTSYTAIGGLLEILTDKKIPRSNPAREEDSMDSFSAGEIIYINERAFRMTQEE